MYCFHHLIRIKTKLPVENMGQSIFFHEEMLLVLCFKTIITKINFFSLSNGELKLPGNKHTLLV